MSDSVVYELKHPIEIKSAKDGTVIETIARLTLRRPKGRHLKATDRVQGEAAKTLALIAACAEIPPSAADEIDLEDVTALGEIVEGFSGAPRRTGETSSAT